MNQDLRISIPIRPYLKKFIANSRDVEPFEIMPNRCHFSKCILEPMINEHRYVDPAINSKATAMLDIKVSEKVLNSRTILIDHALTVKINQALKQMFDQQLIDYITMHNKKVGDIQECVLHFLEYYDISEDDLSYDAAIKMYYRARHYQPKAKQDRMKTVISQLSLAL